MRVSVQLLIAGSFVWAKQNRNANAQSCFFMPSLEEKYINLLKELYRKKEGKDLPDLEAVKKFNNLITLVKGVYRPIPRAKQGELEKLLNKNL